MRTRLITPLELDDWWGYPAGRSSRLAKKGLLPFIKLPDGEMRFDPEVLEKWLSRQTAPIARAEEAKDAEPQ